MACFLNAVKAEPAFQSPNPELLLALKQIQKSNIQMLSYISILMFMHMLLVIQSNTNQHKAIQEQSNTKLTRSNSKNSLWSCWNLKMTDTGSENRYIIKKKISRFYWISS